MATLLVEDNPRLRSSLERGLRECNVAVQAVDSGRAALDWLATCSCDAIILDLGLPDLDGLEVLRGARQTGVVAPVLVLSARDSVEVRVGALDHGADDFLIKPFVFVELVARLRALMRRAAGSAHTRRAPNELQTQALELCKRVGGRKYPLSPRELALFQYLACHAGHVVSRREILSAVFGYAFDPGTNVVDVHIAHLRRKLEGSSVRVETVRGHGYRLQLSTELEREPIGV